MSIEDLQRKLASRLNPQNQSPTPCQIQRQIERNAELQSRLAHLQKEIGIDNIPPLFLDPLADKDPEDPVFIANLKASLEKIARRPDGEILIHLITPNLIRRDGTINIKELKKKI